MHIQQFIDAYPIVMRGAFEAYLNDSSFVDVYGRAATELHFAIWTELEFVDEI